MRFLPNALNKKCYSRVCFSNNCWRTIRLLSWSWCWHSTNIGRSITGLHEELTNERQMHQSIEMKLKEVENELQRERNMREEMAAHFEESQRHS